uniref:PABS domain-containing protein n=2 Tax=Parascaris univalens TaxID=6257 RepID=A0A914ZHU2_PARUN
VKAADSRIQVIRSTQRKFTEIMCSCGFRYSAVLSAITFALIVCGSRCVNYELMKTDFEYTAAIFIDKFIIDRTQFTIHDEILKLRNGSIVIVRLLTANKFYSNVIAAATLKSSHDYNGTINARYLSVDFARVVHLYTKVLIAAPFVTGTFRNHTKTYNVLSIGLGTGVINGYLHDQFQNMNITVVELEETFYKVAQEYFDLTLDHRQRVIISDGLQFLRDHLRSGQAHFDAIYVDACHPEFRYGAICPVEAFLTKDGAKLLHDALADNGTVAVSILVAPEYIAELYTSSFKEVFEQCALVSYSARMANKALICGQRVPEKETLNSEMTAVFEELGFAEFPDETEEGK